MAPLVHAVVINRDGGGLLAPCIGHLLASGYPGLRVTVVDNASSDGSALEAASSFPQISVTHNEKNLGFAAGANVGLRQALEAGADYVWVLNADVFAPPECLELLVEFMRLNPSVGACQPVLVFAHDRATVQSAGCGLGLSGRCWDLAAGIGAASLSREPTVPPGVTGAAMLLRVAALREAGLFDESFFMYFEDVELSLRLRRAGWGMACLGRARASHIGGASASRLPAWRKIFRCERNALVLAARHYPPHLAALGLVLGPLSALAAASLGLARLKPAKAVAYVAGALAGLALGLGQAAARLGPGRPGRGPEGVGRLVARWTIFPPASSVRPGGRDSPGPQLP